MSQYVTVIRVNSDDEDDKLYDVIKDQQNDVSTIKSIFFSRKVNNLRMTWIFQPWFIQKHL